MGNCNQAPEDAGPKLELECSAKEPPKEKAAESVDHKPLPSTEDLLPFEGNLLRHRPEVTQQFIERWCEVTPSRFAYYKNVAAAKLGTEKPLENWAVDLIEAATE